MTRGDEICVTNDLWGQFLIIGRVMRLRCPSAKRCQEWFGRLRGCGCSLAQACGCHARMLLHEEGEIGRAAESEVLGDIAGGMACLSEQQARSIDDTLGQQLGSGFTRCLFYHAGKMGRRDAQFLGVKCHGRAGGIMLRNQPHEIP